MYDGIQAYGGIKVHFLFKNVHVKPQGSILTIWEPNQKLTFSMNLLPFFPNYFVNALSTLF